MTTTQKNELQAIKKLFDDAGIGAAFGRHCIRVSNGDKSPISVSTIEMAQHLIRKAA